MTRGRVVGLVAVLLALVAAFAVRPGTTPKKAPQPASLAPLQQRAQLTPCPTGVSPALPDLVLPCLGGGPGVHLSSRPTGLPTLVNVYGSWCGPCQEEMPVLAGFARQAAGKIALLGVDTNDDPRLALQFAVDVGQHWPAVIDDDKAVLRRYAAGPPVTLFVDRAGKVVHVQSGPFRSLVALRAAVVEHLGVRL